MTCKYSYFVGMKGGMGGGMMGGMMGGGMGGGKRSKFKFVFFLWLSFFFRIKISSFWFINKLS